MNNKLLYLFSAFLSFQDMRTAAAARLYDRCKKINKMLFVNRFLSGARACSTATLLHRQLVLQELEMSIEVFIELVYAVCVMHYIFRDRWKEARLFNVNIVGS